MENFINLKVVLNHKEIKELNSQQFFVYTFTDFDSGNSFDSWNPTKSDDIESMKILTQAETIKFKLVVKKTGVIKLYPIGIVRGVKA